MEQKYLYNNCIGRVNQLLVIRLHHTIGDTTTMTEEGPASPAARAALSDRPCSAAKADPQAQTILPPSKTFAWGKPVTNAGSKQQTPLPAKGASLAEIMAEQTASREANGENNIAETLAEMQAEQERLLLALQGRRRPPPSCLQVPRTAEAGLDEEDLLMIQEALEGSPQDQADGPPSAMVSSIQSVAPLIDSSTSKNFSSGGDRASFIFDSSSQQTLHSQSSLASVDVSRMNDQNTTKLDPPSPKILQPTLGGNSGGASPQQTLSPQELEEIEKAIREADGIECELVEPKALPATAASAGDSHDSNGNLSVEDQAAIYAALKEADAREEQESLIMALRIQQEEIQRVHQGGVRGGSGIGNLNTTPLNRNRQTQGNVRSMTRAQLEEETRRLHELAGGAEGDTLVGAEAYKNDGFVHDETTGFRMNAAPTGNFPDTTSATLAVWSRRDRNTIVGPNNEVRTKHDIHVQGQTNAEFLDLDMDDFGVRAHVGNRAFNSFRQTMKQRGTTKGVASHGTGRAGSDTDATRGKALDPSVRLQISRAINNGLIQRLNGAAKQGKEAIVYHANGGSNTDSTSTTSKLSNDGFDVAVKVFKRITEFKSRGEYVDGDPRYLGPPFRSFTERHQMELWTEKEYRNLIRAHRARVPVPTPLHYKENIIYMRFMGADGWPAPQIREIDMRKGSLKWNILYNQVMESMRRLYVEARLVHGDLSEYNILVSPVFQVDNPIISDEDLVSNDLQAVLIDFGQAVDVRHPHSHDLLVRDVTRVHEFFNKQGAKTLSVKEVIAFVTDEQGKDGSDFDTTMCAHKSTAEPVAKDTPECSVDE